MKRLNLYSAFVALSGPGTKEDIIIQVAKQKNIRFNELPQLQKEVEQALEDSQRLGFIDRQGSLYNLNVEAPPTKSHNNHSQNKATTSKEKNQTNVERNSRQLNGGGGGDGRRSNSAVSSRSSRSSPKLTPISLCSDCSKIDPKTRSEMGKNLSNLDRLLLSREKSVCSICGLNSDNSVNPEEQEVGKCSWANIYENRKVI